MASSPAPTDSEAQALADRLVAILRLGDMSRAYHFLGTMDRRAACSVMLHAGFSTGGYSDRSFWADAQSDIARACRARMSGFELRQHD